MVASKGNEVWLCRDGDGQYRVVLGLKPEWSDQWECWVGPDVGYAPIFKESLAKAIFGHHALEPGGGPIRVRLSMEVVGE